MDGPLCVLADAPRQYQALLEVSQSVASHRDLTMLFRDLVDRLPRVVSFDSLWLVLHDPARNRMRLHLLEGPARESGEENEWPLERPMEESPSALVWSTQTPLVVFNLADDQRYGKAFQLLRDNGIRSCCILPLTTAHRRLGAVGFGYAQLHNYSAADVEFLGQVARQMAVAVDSVLAHEEAGELQAALAEERDRLRLLLDLNNTLAPNLDLRELLRAVSSNVRRVMRCDYTSVILPEPDGQRLRIYARDFSALPEPMAEELVVPRVGTPAGIVLETGKALALDAEELSRFDPKINPTLALGLKSACFLPLVARDRLLGTLNVGRFPERAFTQDDVDFLRQVASQVALAADNALDYHQVAESRQRLAEERVYLNEEIRSGQNFEEIVGSSAALKNVLKQVSIVAPTDSTVLILGETGTGKELIARAIHNVSARRDHTFVKVNCAAIPLGLLESELFGHEKGAFTGAIARRTGRFEVAHQGTLFLDEVGDIPPELQPKLLRVLQEQEFERLGSTQTIKVNVRLVAATSRNLPAMVEQREFRGDLYYRLNIFPLVVPPLRDRSDDVPALVEYFVARFAERLGRKVSRVDRQTMELLQAYHWPGNIRELQNVIERSVILAEGGTLRIDAGVLQTAGPRQIPSQGDVLRQNEKESIEAALAATNGRIAGPHGAAARLRIPASTLESKIRALKIDKFKFRSAAAGDS
ncbi:MAG TPA: sigma 54-interacting transcriptional regulator [Bryobacteraceae bacterium]|jgi:formate hydrogenlyase transcriptional activator|nr:sigma 54-interacting transcriptional regulator [Bryobacteraceae bacterium]